MEIQLEEIDWSLYFNVFEHKSFKNVIKDKINHGFFLFIQALDDEIKSKEPKHALLKYTQAADELEPFSCYRLAELYRKPTPAFVATLKPDFEKSWYYLAKSSVLNLLKYKKDIFQCQKKLGRYLTQLDTEDMQNTIHIIKKYEKPNVAGIIVCGLRLLFSKGEDNRQDLFLELLNHIEKVMQKQPTYHIIEILLCLISVKIDDMASRPMKPLLEVLLKNMDHLAHYSEFLGIHCQILLLVPEDNLVISKLRDLLFQLVYISKIFKFAIKYVDQKALKLSTHLFTIFNKLYEHQDQIGVLQDRVFVLYYLCQMYYNKNKHSLLRSQQQTVNGGGSPDKLIQSVSVPATTPKSKVHKNDKLASLSNTTKPEQPPFARLLNELGTLISLKPQLSVQSFYHYLKAKIEGSEPELQKATQTFQKEAETPNSNQVIINYFLGRIAQKMGQKQAALSHFNAAHQVFEVQEMLWNHTTLITYCYVSKLKRRLKAISSFSPRFFYPANPVYHYEYASHPGQILTTFPHQATTLVAVQPKNITLDKLLLRNHDHLLFQARINNKLCLVEVIPCIKEKQLEVFLKDLQFKHRHSHQNLVTIVGYAVQKHHQNTYHNKQPGQANGQDHQLSLSVIYAHSVIYSAPFFEQKLFVLWKTVQAYNYISSRLDAQYLVPAVSEKGFFGLVGWCTNSSQNNSEPDTNVLNSYRLQFLSSKLRQLKHQDLESYLQKLYLSL